MALLQSDQLLAAVDELRRRQSHPIYQYIPTEVPGHDQKSFHSSPARYRMLFGGNQSGKSLGAAFEIACWLRGKHPYRKIPPPPVNVWAISAEYTTLHSGIFRHLKNLVPDWEIEKFGPNVPQQDLPSFIQLKNGSRVTFKSAKGDSREKFQAAAVHLVEIDEEVTQDIWDELQARTLVTGGNFIISATLINSYEWIIALEQLAEQGDTDYFVTRLDTEKNPYVDHQVLGILRRQWSDDTQRVRFKGLSQRSTGLVYNTWNDTKHKIPAFPIPLSWPRWCSLDPGIRTFAGLWIAVSPDNYAYGYRELYASNTPLWEIAQAVKVAEGYNLDKRLSYKFAHYVWEETDTSERIVTRLIDDRVGSRLITYEEGVLTQLAERYGIICTPADKALRPGIEDVRAWLQDDEKGQPRFRVFDHLDNFLNERRRYRISDKTPKRDSNEPIDQPIKKHDHLMDCWRYIARERPKYEDGYVLRRDDVPFDDTPDAETRENMYSHGALIRRVERKRESLGLDSYFGSEG